LLSPPWHDLLWCAPVIQERLVGKPTDRRFVRWPVVGALAVALAFTVAACGRKGPLDPPPSASIQPQAGEEAAAPAPAAGPTPRRKSFFLDWLLD
jgi:predicted small lipoprotein YifL